MRRETADSQSPDARSYTTVVENKPRPNGVGGDGDSLREVVGVIVVPAWLISLRASERWKLYAQIPDIVSLLRLTVVNADAVVALMGNESASHTTRTVELAEIATK